jgi:hypothetical protein
MYVVVPQEQNIVQVEKQKARIKERKRLANKFQSFVL